jgi:hypothetical protein
MEGFPSFRPIYDTSDQDDSFGGALSSSTIYSDSSSATRRLTRVTVAVTFCQFLRCFALGSTFFTGSGGAAALYHGGLSVRGSTFDSNMAFSGGSLFVVDGSLSARQNGHTGDFAIESGGSIFAMGYDPVDPPNDTFYLDHTCHVVGCAFSGCTSGQVGGAVSLHRLNDVHVDTSVFRNCSAGHSGGALYHFQSDVGVSGCKFVRNFCGLNAPKLPFKTKASRRLGMAKGGGAIFSYVEYNPHHEWGYMELYIDACCFFVNRVYNGETGPANGGFDVLNVGDGTFRAYWTAFTTPEALSYQNSERAQYCETMPCGIDVDVSQAEFGVAWNTTTDYSQCCGSLIYEWPPYDVVTAFPSTETFADVTPPTPPSSDPLTSSVPATASQGAPPVPTTAAAIPDDSSRSPSTVGVVLGAVFGVVALTAAALGFLVCRLRRKPAYPSDLYRSMVNQGAEYQYDTEPSGSDSRTPAQGEDYRGAPSDDGIMGPLLRV